MIDACPYSFDATIVSRFGQAVQRTIVAILPAVAAWLLVHAIPGSACAQVLDRKALFEAERWRDNLDFDWFDANTPFFDCPDQELKTTYAYRWELLTKHLTYGAPATGYVFTEFIDRPVWSGRYGAISCPAGHQLYEARWLRDPRIARDYSRYWFRTPGAEPRRYGTWLADAIGAVDLVHPNRAFLVGLLPDLVKNYEGWEREKFDAAVGLFRQTGHDDGMEININSRQTSDPVRGAPGFRPTLNSYLYADALAIARIADLAGEGALGKLYREKADALKRNLQKKLWDADREFFLQMYARDEERQGHKIKAGTLTYRSGRYAGDPHGREEIGFVPWQFNLPDRGYESAWKLLMRHDGFFAEFGPTVVERNDPQFQVTKTCCVWSGQSWPYATTQTLVAMANLIRNYEQNIITKRDYYKLLSIYSNTHRKHGRPYIAEAADPFDGSWEGYDSYNHSEHYFHSGFIDIVITGLVGLIPRADDILEIRPLAPETWSYWALENVRYHDHDITIVWDKSGERYRKGAGLFAWIDGAPSSERARTLGKLEIKLPPPKSKAIPQELVNLAVNNENAYFPRASASFSTPGTAPETAIDGNYWYHADPPNRWMAQGSRNAVDWFEIDFGIGRSIDEIKLYFLDDGKGLIPPESVRLTYWNGDSWRPIPGAEEHDRWSGRRAETIRFPTLQAWRIRATLTHARGGRSGLTEFEAWGDALQVVEPPPPPRNLALNAFDKAFPKASASFTSRFDKVEEAINGKIQFRANPRDRWTSYESPNASDWLAVDFGSKTRIERIELAIYDDGGGVRAPKRYWAEYWDGKAWRAAANPRYQPEAPAGGRFNDVAFDPVETEKVRIVFEHAGSARSGVTELIVQ